MNFINQAPLINCYEVLLIHFLCISVIFARRPNNLPGDLKPVRAGVAFSGVAINSRRAAPPRRASAQLKTQNVFSISAYGSTIIPI